MLARVQLVCGISALLSMAAPNAKAESVEAPLEKSSRDLRALESTRQLPATSTEPTGEGAKGFALTIPDATPAQPPRAPRPQSENQPRGNRASNWLLNGVRQLESLSQNPQPGDRTKEGDSGSRENPSIEKSGLDEKAPPQSLLEVYSQQRERDLAAERSARPDERNSRPDAFAPFLENWLASSSSGYSGVEQPARGRRTSTSDSLRGSETGVRAQTRPGGASSDFTLAPATAPIVTNPYLPPEEFSVSQLVSPAGAGNSPVASLEVTPPAQKISPTAGGGAVLPPVPNHPKLPPVVPSTEDKKYFPQLKKF